MNTSTSLTIRKSPKGGKKVRTQVQFMDLKVWPELLELWNNFHLYIYFLFSLARRILNFLKFQISFKLQSKCRHLKLSPLTGRVIWKHISNIAVKK